MKRILFVILLLINNSIVSAQAIDKSKKELNSNSSSKTNNTNQSSNANSKVDPEDVGLFLEILGYVVCGAYYGLIGDYGNESHLHNNLSKYPFSDKEIGNYTESDTLTNKTFRLDIEDHYISNGNLYNGNHLDIKIRPSKYFYLKTDYYQLSERNLFTNNRDKLSLFYFNVGYDRIRIEKFNLGWTAGISYVGNEVQKGGFSFGLNTEYFFVRNISVAVDSKWSNINYNPVHSFEVKGKYFRKNYYGSLSFERLKIATPVYTFIGIGCGVYF